MFVDNVCCCFLSRSDFFFDKKREGILQTALVTKELTSTTE